MSLFGYWLIKLLRGYLVKLKKLIVLFIFTLFTVLSANSDIKDLKLNDEEKQWLENNKVIKLAIMSYWPKNEKGSNTHYGIIELINKYIDATIIPVTFNSWGKGYAEAKEGKNIYGILGLSYNKDREKYFYYSPVYEFTPAYLVVKKSNKTIKKFSDLRNKKVLLKKSAITTNIVKSTFKDNITIDYFDDVQSMYEKLFSTKKSEDAILAYYVDQKEIQKYGLKIIDTVYDKTGEVSIGINKNHPLLVSIIDKVFKNISSEELYQIRNQGKISLNKTQMKWLKKDGVIKYIVPFEKKPIQWFDELRSHIGITSDIINILQEKTDIVFRSVTDEKESLKEMTEFSDKNESFMVVGIEQTKENKSKYIFTKNSYYSVPYVFLTSKKIQEVKSFNEIANYKIGVFNNSSMADNLKEYYPKLKFTSFSDPNSAIRELEKNKIDILIINALSAKYYLNILHHDELHIAYKTIFNYDFKLAFSKNTPEVAVSLIDGALLQITKKELDDIVHKWTEVIIESKTDWMEVFKIVGVIILVLIVVFIHNQKLKSMVEKKTKDINEQKKELENLLSSFDKNVIFSKTDLKGNIIHASEAFCKISGYSLNELVGKPHNIVRHPDTPRKVFKDIWSSLQKEIPITRDIKNLRKDGSFYWVESKFSPEYDSKGNHIGYSAVRHDITSKKEVQQLSKDLEKKVEERTHDLEKTKEEVEQILASILLPVLITDKYSRKIVYANKYAESKYDTTLDKMIGSSIEELYITKGQSEELVNQMRTKGRIENLEQSFKTHTGKEFIALLSVIPIRYRSRECYIGMTTDITHQKQIEEQVRQMHKHTRDSIEYASLIQYALIPSNESFQSTFSDFFTFWQPKDIVGGDIYLFEKINDNESLLFVIDCTGHGVPGAFVTMLVKAIERQVSALINNNDFIQVSPSWILSYFNKTIKKLLKQDREDSISNAGFDGAVLYYNKSESVVKFSGAETPLFYFDENNDLKVIKGSRHSIGYKKSDAEYEFKEHEINVKSGMKFYLTTDGYLDQNGGEKEFPFGKKRFQKILEENNEKIFQEQKEIFVKELEEYQQDHERNDDVTVIGIKI